MRGLSHFLGVGPFFQTGLAIGVDTIWALHGMSDAERDQCFFTFRERAFGKDRAVIAHELVPKILIALAHVGELMEIRRMIIGIHSAPKVEALSESVCPLNLCLSINVSLRRARLVRLCFRQKLRKTLSDH